MSTTGKLVCLTIVAGGDDDSHRSEIPDYKYCLRRNIDDPRWRKELKRSWPAAGLHIQRR
jgi:hypothetical protein